MLTMKKYVHIHHIYKDKSYFYCSYYQDNNLLFAIITVQKTPIREETYVLKKNTMYRKIHRLNMQYICSCTKKLSCFYAVVISQKKLCAVCCLFLCCFYVALWPKSPIFVQKILSLFCCK